MSSWLKDNFVTVCTVIFIIICVVVFLVTHWDTIYECTDTFGNIIYCPYAAKDKTGMYARMDDGTMVKITQYKLIKKRR